VEFLVGIFGLGERIDVETQRSAAVDDLPRQTGCGDGEAFARAVLRALG